MAERQYIAGRGLAVSTYLALRLQRPLFLEGEPGVGKTEVAKVLASTLDTELIRLQCYEGLDISHAVYEWNYPRQILEIRLLESAHALDPKPAERELFTDAFLIKRPLLRAIEQTRARPPVLLIDEIDRADEEFEGYLLELLSDFQITIPELGTIRAAEPPVVVITSNRTREVHDALKRRCVYSWIDYPDAETERRIVAARLPGVPARLAAQMTAFVQELRTAELYKTAGVSETLDWAAALVALDRDELDAGTVDETLGILLKNQEDIQAVRGERVQAMLDRALARRRGLDEPGLQRPAVRTPAACGGARGPSRPPAGRGARARMGRASAAAPMSRRRCAACSSTITTRSEKFDRAFELFFRPHRAPAPGLPLFSLGERPRVVAVPALRCARFTTELEDVHAGSAAAPRVRSAHGARRACRGRRTSASSPIASSKRARPLLERLPVEPGPPPHAPMAARLQRRVRISGPVLRRNVMLGDLDRPSATHAAGTAAPDRAARRRQRIHGAIQPSADCISSTVWPSSATRVEVFLFATRLTRDHAAPDRASWQPCADAPCP